MKKVLILILIVLLAVLCYNVVTSGYEIAGLKILNLTEIQAENEKLNTTLSEIDNLKEVEYPAKLSEMNTAAKNLRSSKKTYEELAAYSSEQDVLNATQTERYDIEVLWVSIGNHAEETGVIPKLEVLSSSNNTTGANDLRITATGNYIGITDFVREIEDDSKLGFAIENFELIPLSSASGAQLQASFKIKDIFINADTTILNTTETNTENNAQTTEGNEITNSITNTQNVNNNQ